MTFHSCTSPRLGEYSKSTCCSGGRPRTVLGPGNLRLAGLEKVLGLDNLQHLATATATLASTTATTTYHVSPNIKKRQALPVLHDPYHIESQAASQPWPQPLR